MSPPTTAPLPRVPEAAAPPSPGVPDRYAEASIPAGTLLVAWNDRGVCLVRLGDRTGGVRADLNRAFPTAPPRGAPRGGRPWLDAVAKYLEAPSPDLRVPTDVAGTPFQHWVWDALQAIPFGETRSYAEVAAEIGRPGAARAVAGACAANPVPFVVPCHRVVRSDGSLGGFGLGTHLKAWLLDRERSRE